MKTLAGAPPHEKRRLLDKAVRCEQDVQTYRELATTLKDPEEVEQALRYVLIYEQAAKQFRDEAAKLRAPETTSVIRPAATVIRRVPTVARRSLGGRRPVARRVVRVAAATESPGRSSSGDDPADPAPPLGRLQENAEASGGFTHISSLIAAELARLRSSR